MADSLSNVRNVLARAGFVSENQQNAIIGLLEKICLQIPSEDRPSAPETAIEKLTEFYRSDPAIEFNCSREAGAAKSINALMQREFIRTSEDSSDSKDLAKQREDLAFLLTQAGMGEEIVPNDGIKTPYHYTVIFGAKEFAVKKRVEYCKKLESQGLKLGTIISLGDEKSEFPMMHDIYRRTHSVEWGAAFPASELSRTATVKTPAPEGKQRSNTRETLQDLHAYLREHHAPDDARILFISNQPNVAYQDIVAANEFTAQNQIYGTHFQVETVGPAMDITPKAVPMSLDRLARIVYETNARYSGNTQAQGCNRGG